MQLINAIQGICFSSSYEAQAKLVGRFLQHFPSRNTVSDAVFISDLAGDFVDEGVSIGAAAFTLDQIRKEARQERPFVPPSGEILARAKANQEKMGKAWEYHINAKPAEKPKAEPKNRAAPRTHKQPVQWYGKTWKQLSASDLDALHDHLAAMPWEKRKEYAQYLHEHWDFPANLIQKLAEREAGFAL